MKFKKFMAALMALLICFSGGHYSFIETGRLQAANTVTVTVENGGHCPDLQLEVAAGSSCQELVQDIISNDKIVYRDGDYMLQTFNIGTLTSWEDVMCYTFQEDTTVKSVWASEIKKVELTVNKPVVLREVKGYDDPDTGEWIAQNYPVVSVGASDQYGLVQWQGGTCWFTDDNLDLSRVKLAEGYTPADPNNYPMAYQGIIDDHNFIFGANLEARNGYAFSEQTEIYVNNEKVDTRTFCSVTGWGMGEHFWNTNPEFTTDTLLSVYAPIETEGKYVRVSDIQIESSYTIDLHETLTLQPVIVPDNASYKTPAFEIVSGRDVIELNDGVVSPLKIGQTVIKVSCGGFEKTTTINVEELAFSFSCGILAKTSSGLSWSEPLYTHSFETKAGDSGNNGDYAYVFDRGYVRDGQQATVTTRRISGYTFQGWYLVDDSIYDDYDFEKYTKVSDDMSYTFTLGKNADKDMILYAFFIENDRIHFYTSFTTDDTLVDWYNFSEGQISFDGGLEYCEISAPEGKEVNLSLNQKVGTRFSGWYLCDSYTRDFKNEGTLVSSDSNYTFTVDQSLAGKYLIADVVASTETYDITVNTNGIGDNALIHGILSGSQLYESVDAVVRDSMIPAKVGDKAVIMFYWIDETGKERDVYDNCPVQKNETLYVRWATEIDKVELNLKRPDPADEVYYDSENHKAVNYPQAEITNADAHCTLVRRSADEYGVWLRNIDFSKLTLTGRYPEDPEWVSGKIETVPGLIASIAFNADEGYIFTENTEFYINGEKADGVNFYGFTGFGGPGHLWMTNSDFSQDTYISALYKFKAQSDINVRLVKNVPDLSTWTTWFGDLVVNQVRYTDSDITVTGGGTFKENEVAEITITSDGSKAFAAELSAVDGDGNHIDIPEFYDRVIFDKAAGTKKVSFTVPEVEDINITVSVTDSLVIRMVNDQPGLYTVDQFTTVKMGEPVEIVFDCQDGYELSDGRRVIGEGHGDMAYNGSFYTPDFSDINTDVVDRSVKNRLAWTAGWGETELHADVIYVGYNSNDEKKLEEAITVEENNNYQAPGIAILNETEDTKEYTVELSSTNTLTGFSRLRVPGSDGFRLMASGVEAIEDTSGIGSVILYITVGKVGEEDKAVKSTKTVDNLSSLKITVEPGEFVTYSIATNDEQPQPLYQYSYVITDTTNQEEPVKVEQGMVYSDDTVKHLIVSDKIGITSVKLDKNLAEMNVGETGSLSAVINPADTTEEKTVTWSSSDPDVVYVDGQGNISALKAGEAVITATAVNGVTGECKVTVNEYQMPEDAKFAITVSSKSNDHSVGSVSAVVFEDYHGELTAKGTYVNDNNVTVDLWMQNVASLGVDSLRHYGITVHPGSGKEHSISTVTNLLKNLDGTSVTAIVGDKSVKYTAELVEGDDFLMKATPESASKAREVWHTLINNKTVRSYTGEDDSMIIIANGSYFTVGNEKLVFEDEYEDDLKIDGLNNLDRVVTEIRKALKVAEGDNKIEAFLMPGTVLSVGQSKLELLQELKVNIEVSDSSEYNGLLSELREAQGGDALIQGAFNLLVKVIGDIQGTNTDVIFSLDHDWSEPEWNWVDNENVTATFTCRNVEEHVETIAAEVTVTSDGYTRTYTATVIGPDGKIYSDEKKEAELGDNVKFRIKVSSQGSDNTVGSVTASVFNDYHGEIVVDGNLVNENNVTVEMWMQNVGSLSVDDLRHFSYTLSLGEGEHALTTLKNVLFDPLADGTKITARIDDKAVTYQFSKAEGDRYVVMMTPDSEENARSVWHALFNEETIKSYIGEDDSNIIIANGSYLTIGDEKLVFEEGYKDDLVIDNLKDLDSVIKNIKDAVTITEGNNKIEGFLMPGTTLSVGQSKLELLKEIKFDVNVTDASVYNGTLSAIREANSGSGLVQGAFGLMLKVMDDIRGKTTEAVFEYGHKMIAHEAVAPTCVEEGTEAYWECSVCGKLFLDEQGVTEIEAPVVVPAAGHQPAAAVKENNVEPTCTEDGGYDMVVYCSVCNEELSREHVVVEATGHVAGEAVKENEVAPTCTAAGSYDEVVYCSVCHAELSRETKTVAALGHDFGEWKVTKEPTCTEKGEETRECGRCHEKETRPVEALGHVAGEAKQENVKEATCTEKGSYDLVVRCTRCNEIISSEHHEIEALGHSWSEWKVTKEPTCTEKGEESRECSRCHEKETREIDMIDHKWDDGTIIEEPTFSKTGIIEYKCLVCGETRREEMPKGKVVNMVVGSESTFTIAVNENNYMYFESDSPEIANAGIISVGTMDSNGTTKYTRKIRVLADSVGFAKIAMKVNESTLAYIYAVVSAGNDNVVRCVGAEKVITLTTFGEHNFKVSNPDIRVYVTREKKVTRVIIGSETYEAPAYVNTITLSFDKPVKDEKVVITTESGEVYYLNVNVADHEWGKWTYDGEEAKTHTHVCSRDPEHKETAKCEFDEGVAVGSYIVYTCKVCGGTYAIKSDVPEKQEVIRVAGDNRFGTSQKIASAIAQIEDIEKFDAIILANGDVFADALAGSYLAAEKNAPIIITRSGKEAEVNAYIRSVLKPNGTIYVLGGTAAVPEACLNGLVGRGYSITRLWGSNRYLTNLDILDTLGVSGDKILVATGNNFADSLSASATGLPILLVRDDGLTVEQREFLSRNTGKEFIILGGTSAVTELIEKQLIDYGTVRRIRGANRAGTSIEIAKEFFTYADSAVVAYSHEFPDGLCGGPLANQIGAPLLLTRDENSDVTAAYMKSKDIHSGYVLGGPVRLTDTIVRKVFGLGSSDKIIEFEE
ncbi:MAG: hypothetical protein E7187_00140 [Erysipelotrichaceae bacterium]|nr:hypothetical protein [Erysipelotrichaceae bacterium]